MTSSPRIASSATVESGASIGDDTTIWDLTQVRAGASVGTQCVIGRNVFIDAGVVIGDRCKVQNNALVYAPARVGNGVFIGPAVVLTNDRHPRAVDPDGQVKGADAWTAEGVVVEDGASVGAAAVVLAGVTVGAWALIAANTMVTKDVPEFALVAGSPARRVGWVGPSGRRLHERGSSRWVCPITGAGFVETGPDELRAE